MVDVLLERQERPEDVYVRWLPDFAGIWEDFYDWPSRSLEHVPDGDCHGSGWNQAFPGQTVWFRCKGPVGRGSAVGRI